MRGWIFSVARPECCLLPDRMSVGIRRSPDSQPQLSLQRQTGHNIREFLGIAAVKYILEHPDIHPVIYSDSSTAIARIITANPLSSRHCPAPLKAEIFLKAIDEKIKGIREHMGIIGHGARFRRILGRNECMHTRTHMFAYCLPTTPIGTHILSLKQHRKKRLCEVDAKQ